MKILFLDIDGVLNSEYYSSKIELIIFYEIKKINLVKGIVDKTKCKIVLTSLRLNYQLYDNEIKDVLKKEGLEVYDTLKVPFSDKVYAIKEWLSNKKVSDYIVVDDSNYKTFENHFVKTSPKYGLTKSKANKIIGLFNNVTNKLQNLLTETKNRLKHEILIQQELDVFFDNIIDLCDNTYKKYHEICTSQDIYDENKMLCKEIENIIFLMHKYTFAVEVLMGYNKEDIAHELKIQGFQMNEITNVLIKSNDKEYDTNKSLLM